MEEPNSEHLNENRQQSAGYAHIFERHGFIWGGKWHHYDTMHFEYRPELLHPRCVDRRT